MLLMLPPNANLQHLHFHLKSRSQVLAGRPWAVAWLLRVPHLCGSCQALATGVQTAEWMLPTVSVYTADYQMEEQQCHSREAWPVCRGSG